MLTALLLVRRYRVVKPAPSQLAAWLPFAAALLAASPLAAQDGAHSSVSARNLIGTLSCASASCHGSGIPYGGSTRISQQEFLHWLGSGATYADGRRHYDPRARLE